MLEAGALIGEGHEVLHWHDPDNRTSVCLPDSPTLWDYFWGHRKILLGFAHTHPGSGVPAPSSTDLSTFEAIELGLGIHIAWWIFSENRGIVIQRKSFDSLWHCVEVAKDFYWVERLRDKSFYYDDNY